jgi:hypothetical protein
MTDRRERSDEAKQGRLVRQADILGFHAVTLAGLSDAEWVAFAKDAGVQISLPRDAGLCGRAVDLVFAAEEASILLHETGAA